MEINHAYEPAERAYEPVEPLHLNDERNNLARRDNPAPRKSTGRYCATTITALIFAILSIMTLAGIVVAVVLYSLKSMGKSIQFHVPFFLK